MQFRRKIGRIGLVGVLLATLFSTGAPAPAQQKTVLTEPPTPLLPATLGKLTRAAPGDSGDGLGGLDAAGLTPQDKAVLAEDGLKRFAKSDYGNSPIDLPGAPEWKDPLVIGPNGKIHAKEPSASNAKVFLPLATITVFSFHDASGAISAYAYFRRDGMRAEKLADDAVADSDEQLMRSGLNVVMLTHSRLGREETSSVVNELIVHLPKALGTTGISPLLPTLLAQKNLAPDSVKYALGPAGYAAMNGVLPADSIGFDKSAEAVTAKYRNGGTLTLLLYPTPQIAGDHERAAQSVLSQATVRREGPLVAVATGGWPSGLAQKTVDSVHLPMETSFDRPMPLEFHTEIAKTYTLLESIAMFCGVGALAAIVLGLFFGGGRALIRVMQGKPAYTEPEFLHIDLRGRPHEIRRSPEA